MKIEGNPDNLERNIRFGCGALLGIFVAILSATSIAYNSLGTFAAISFAFAFLFGLFAMAYGDRFWEYILKSLRWFWWH